MNVRRIAISLLLLFSALNLLSLLYAKGDKNKNAMSVPSENKGRRGEYSVDTPQPNVSYFVCVPDTYSDTNPAGIHVHFHGSGGDWKSAEKFGQWKKTFLERFNLIGINMQVKPEAYSDKNFTSETGVELLEKAINQVAADYKIITGRGVISSFSGGGLFHGDYIVKHSDNCHFNHSAAYSSNFVAKPKETPQMSWIVTVGRDEWLYQGIPLGITQTQLFDRLLKNNKKGCKDILFKTMVGKTHTVANEEIEASAEIFYRSDLFLSPYVYEADFSSDKIIPLAKKANALRYGEVIEGIDKLLKKETDTDCAAMANRLKDLTISRMQNSLELLKKLSETDIVISMYYGEILLKNCAKTSMQKDVKAVLSAIKKKKEFKRAQEADKLFAKNFNNFFMPTEGMEVTEDGKIIAKKQPHGNVTGKINPEQMKVLQQIRDSISVQSQIGSMVTEFLQTGK